MDYQMTELGKKSLKKDCFADDTIFFNKPCTIFVARNNIEKILDHEFENFKKWCNKWKLVINKKKNEWTSFFTPNKKRKKNIEKKDEDKRIKKEDIHTSHDPQLIIQTF